jgi:hypothetical protein
MPAWLLVLLGCCGGCGLVLVITAALFGVGLRALFAPKVPPPSAYVGIWQGADNTTLAIGKDGVASYRYTHTGGAGSSSGAITGGRIKVDEARHTLRIEISGLGTTWRIDQPPHMANGRGGRQADFSAMQMKLNGILFRRQSAESSGMLSSDGGGSSSGGGASSSE